MMTDKITGGYSEPSKTNILLHDLLDTSTLNIVRMFV